MNSVYVCLWAFLLLKTVAGQCPVFGPVSCYDDDQDEGMCEDDEDCSPGQICCTIGCSIQCVDPVGQTTEPPSTTESQQTKAASCFSQSDCETQQCCTNTTSGAQTGICQDRKQIADDCHNPNPTGFSHSGCRSPSAIIHPDLCPCQCDYVCSPGPPNGYGGYRGICMFW
ncbi:whey acidic protein-like [Gigantopelta aegis]|uniref:whey acidic protein-like n=1 Tax=Gigantopelta aegis TaxID=1735272 RepID=UPI001B888E55|nr:whey acidic protein-like [Gigantopelta aegis]